MTTPLPPAIPENTNFSAKFAELFDSPTYSDLTVRVVPYDGGSSGGGGSSSDSGKGKAGANKDADKDTGTSFRVHQNILSLRTDFFASAVRHGFEEAKESVVTLHEHSVMAVRRVLLYCYTGDYPNVFAEKALNEDDDGMLKHSHVYALADMLGMDGLQALAAQKQRADLVANWCSTDFYTLVADVYSTTGPHAHDLRGVLIDTARKHLPELLKDGNFKTALMQFGEFSGALVLKSV